MECVSEVEDTFQRFQLEKSALSRFADKGPRPRVPRNIKDFCRCWPDRIYLNDGNLHSQHPHQRRLVQDKHRSPIIRRMTTSDEIYVLYKDVPRKRYRRIAAKSERSPSHLQFFVEMTEG
jgi:hypothetical protein